MANEIDTGASAGEMIMAEILMNEIQPAAYGPTVMLPLVRQESIAGQPTLTGEYTKDPKLSAAGLTDGVAVANTAYDPTSVTVSTAEVGLSLELTDLMREGSILNIEHLSRIASRAVAEKIDTDLLAEISDLTTSVSDTGANMDNGDVLSAVYNIKAQNAQDYGPIHGVLHPITVFDWMTSIASITGTVLGTESFGGSGPFSVDRGFNIYGIEFHESTLCPSLNTNADRGGVIFPAGAMAPFVFQDKRSIRVELERDAKMRSWSTVVTTAYGDETVDTGLGVLLVFDHE